MNFFGLAVKNFNANGVVEILKQSGIESSVGTIDLISLRDAGGLQIQVTSADERVQNGRCGSSYRRLSLAASFFEKPCTRSIVAWRFLALLRDGDHPSHAPNPQASLQVERWRKIVQG